MALLTRWARPLPLGRSLLALGCMALAGRELRAQTAPPVSEQEVKAAYLFNFTRYVDWPANAFDAPDAPVNLCVLGEGDFGEVVRQTVAGQRSRGRIVRVLEPDEPSQAADCHVAFLPSRPREARSWLQALRRSATLTVGDGPVLLQRGGMIAFVTVNQTLRFEIDATAVRRAGLQISSRVLALATRVTEEPEAPR